MNLSFWEGFFAIIILLLFIIGGVLASIPILVLGGLGLFFYMAYAFVKYLNSIATVVQCRLVKRRVFKDECSGNCLAGQLCYPTAWRPYGPRWMGFKQPLACACTVIVAAGPGNGSSAHDETSGSAVGD